MLVYASAGSRQSIFLFCFIHTAPTGNYTLSLHDALPIYWPSSTEMSEQEVGTWKMKSGAMFSWATGTQDRKSTRLNSSHANISYAVFCLKKKKSHPTTNYQTNSALNYNRKHELRPNDHNS